MIVPKRVPGVREVGGHYDGLDTIYRALWGEHVHHGLWETGAETVAQATDALSLRVAAGLGLADGLGATPALADIGCGYGATAALFARRFDARVTGFTLSAAQAAVARARGDARLACHVRDWMENGLGDATQDGAYAIESSEHMADKPRFFAEAARVLKPGARLVVCAWLAADAPGKLAVDHLLEPICREGRLPGMGTRGEYAAMARAAGLRELSYEDISRQVARTWTICARRFARAMLTDAPLRALVYRSPDRSFALSLPRLMLAYRTGAMRYGVFAFEAA